MKRPASPPTGTRASRVAIALAWLACVVVPAHGASVPMQFRHLTAEDGLSQNTVTSILQDRQGFVWLGTAGGLDQYDGTLIRHFLPVRGDEHSLPGSVIEAVREDAQGDLWLAVKDAGVAHFNRRTEIFQGYTHNSEDSSSLSSDNVSDVALTADGNLWVAHLDTGLDLLNPRTGTSLHLRHDEHQPASLADDHVNALAIDRNGQLWVATHSGLDRWDPVSRRFTHFQPDASREGQVPGRNVTALYVDREGVLWAGFAGEGRFSRFDSDSQRFVSYRLPAEQFATTFLEDTDGRLWVGTTHGLVLLDRLSGTLTRYERDLSDLNSLSDNDIKSLYQDRSGLLWIGTTDGGVNLWNPRSWLLGHEHPAWLQGTYAIAFAAADAGRLWVGSQGAGLQRFDPVTHASEPVDAIYHRAHVLPDQRIMALYSDGPKSLWVGTMTHGLQHLTAAGIAESYRASAGGALDFASLGNDGVMALLGTRDGRLWVGTFGGGLSIVDPRAQRVVRAGAADPAFFRARVSALAEDARGIVWAGTDGQGLLALTREGEILGHWRHDKTNPQSLASNTIYALSVDAAGTLWVGTDSGGLDHFIGAPENPAAVRFENRAMSSGLPGNAIFGIEGDAAGGLWLSGSRGLVRLQPDTGQLRLFHRGQGLQGEEFNYSAHYRLPDGRLVFGGSNGFNLFDPTRVMAIPASQPRLALTSVTIKGQPAVLGGPLATLNQLTLSYRDDVVSFGVACLDFTSPAKNQYQYRLQGFDKEWTTSPVGQRATYTNLDAGHYVFQARALAADGVASRDVFALPLQVKAAPWRSMDAYATYATGIALCLLLWYRAQQRKLRRAAEQGARLEKEVQLRTVELKKSNEELLRLSRAKSDFLARMSHEIRTPMNGILGMTALLLRSELNPLQSRHASTVHRSAHSLMSLLNDTLDLAKVEAGKLELEHAPFDLNNVMAEAVETFAAQAAAKGLELMAGPAPNLEHAVVGDALRLRQVLLNLIGNAIKFTATGAISVFAEATPTQDGRVELSLSVRDSGIGMTRDVVERIFDPFSQADESTTRRFGGTGLGLSICREFIDLMGGRLEVQSTPGVGSAFTATISLALGDLLPVTTVSLPWPVAFYTRLPRLAQAVERHTRRLGVELELPDMSDLATLGTDAKAEPRVILIDADSAAAELAALCARGLPPALRGRVLLLGRDAHAMVQALLGDGHEGCALDKPLRLEALQAQLERLAVPGEVPVAAAGPSCAPAQAEFAPLHGHVLVVEDNEVNAAVIEGMLNELGCSHVTVTRGPQALLRATTERFDAVLLDMHMPGMDGQATASLLRRTPQGLAGLPIIACTADPAQTHRARCLDAGMADFISKPVTLQALHAVLARWLSRPAVPSARPTPSVTTPAGLTQLAQHSTGLMARVHGLFLSQLREQAPVIATALEQGDRATVKSCCHSLKSSAAHVGETALAALATRLEALARDGNDGLLRELTPLFHEAVATACDHIDAQLRKQSA